MWARPAVGKHLTQIVNQGFFLGGYLSLRFQDKCIPTASHPAHTVTLAGYCKCMVMNVMAKVTEGTHSHFIHLRYICQDTLPSEVLVLGPLIKVHF